MSMGLAGAAPPPARVGAGGEAGSVRVVVLLDSHADEQALARAGIALCARHADASLTLVHLQRAAAAPVAMEAIEWDGLIAQLLREEKLLDAALAEVPPGLPVDPVRISGARIGSAAVRRVVRDAGVVVAPCRCRPALGHRPWCRAARLARALDVPVVAVKTLGAVARRVT